MLGAVGGEVADRGGAGEDFGLGPDVDVHPGHRPEVEQEQGGPGEGRPSANAGARTAAPGQRLGGRRDEHDQGEPVGGPAHRAVAVEQSQAAEAGHSRDGRQREPEPGSPRGAFHRGRVGAEQGVGRAAGEQGGGEGGEQEHPRGEGEEAEARQLADQLRAPQGEGDQAEPDDRLEAGSAAGGEGAQGRGAGPKDAQAAAIFPVLEAPQGRGGRADQAQQGRGHVVRRERGDALGVASPFPGRLHGRQQLCRQQQECDRRAQDAARQPEGQGAGGMGRAVACECGVSAPLSPRERVRVRGRGARPRHGITDSLALCLTRPSATSSGGQRGCDIPPAGGVERGAQGPEHQEEAGVEGPLGVGAQGEDGERGAGPGGEQEAPATQGGLGQQQDDRQPREAGRHVMACAQEVEHPFAGEHEA